MSAQKLSFCDLLMVQLLQPSFNFEVTTKNVLLELLNKVSSSNPMDWKIKKATLRTRVGLKNWKDILYGNCKKPSLRNEEVENIKPLSEDILLKMDDKPLVEKMLACKEQIKKIDDFIDSIFWAEGSLDCDGQRK